MVMLATDKQYPKLLHETDAGQPCLVCGDDCPGLEVHFWRKICINCKCPVSDHQTTSIITEVNTKAKLLDENIRAQFECSNYSWIPPGLNKDQVEQYMKCLPPEQRPIIGTVGEQYRRKLIMTQLPTHDHNPSSSLTPAETEEFLEFSKLRYEMSYGVGEVKPISPEQAEMFDCRTCQSPLDVDQLGVFAAMAGPNCIWCVACFKCDVCEEPLADLHYFYKDGEIFCGRHHAELLKPRCAACDELILAKEYTLAEDRNWHLNHFCCWECDRMLGGRRYVTRDDHPFCIDCYDDLFAPLCKKCSLPIGLDNAHMVHKEYHWHATESCFFCENCQVSLIASPFLLKFDEIFCSSACAQEFANSDNAEHPNKVPKIQVIEDNPADNIQGILRKDSSPTSPKDQDQKRKVMFNVEASLDIPESNSEVKRSYSEEEFEYLEQSLNDGKVDIDIPAAEKQDSSISPLSESTLSTSPLSDNNVEEAFFERKPQDEDQVVKEDEPPTNEKENGDLPSNGSDEDGLVTCNGAEEVKVVLNAQPSVAKEEAIVDVPMDADDIGVKLTVESEDVSSNGSRECVAMETRGVDSTDEEVPAVTETKPEIVIDTVGGDKENEKRPEVRKPTRAKLSSSSFNRVLRRIDQHGNDSLFVERPGKRLRNRPRSLSSLGSSRANSNIEQRENLVNMYALAPDIADMIASVYRDQNSINTTIKSVDTSRQDNRTLGSPTSHEATVEDADSPPNRGLHKRNASYEAAELVLEMEVESEGEEKKEDRKVEEAGVATTKHITIEKSPKSSISPRKSPRKSIKERLSFRKKKEKKGGSGGENAPGDDKEPSGTPPKKQRKDKRICAIM